MLRVLNWLYIGIIHALAYLSVALLFLVTAWTCLEVFSRLFGFGVLSGVVEFTEYAIFAMALLAAPWILHKRAHVRVMVAIESLPRGLQRTAEVVVDVAAAGVCLVLTYYALLNFLTALERGELIFGELIFPEWYLHWQAPLALGLLAIGFLRTAVLAFRGGPLSGDVVKE